MKKKNMAVLASSLIILNPVSGSIAHAGMISWMIHAVPRYIDEFGDVLKRRFVHGMERNVEKIRRYKWPDTHAKGRFGDYVTTRRMTGMGYRKLKSKTSSIHGIDGVFAKYGKNGEIEEIVIIENKVDLARLNPGPPRQMSDKWLEKKVQEMISSRDPAARKTGDMLDHYMKHKPDRVKRELWHHDTGSGTTTRYRIDSNGYQAGMIHQWDDRLVHNTLDRICDKETLSCS